MATQHKALMATAREYCRLIESAQPGNDEWLSELAQLLPRLHALVAVMEPASADSGSEPELDLDLDSRFEMFSHLHETLGDRDSYWLEFDSPRGALPATGSLADDLTDIYYDLKLGLDRLAIEPDDLAPTLSDWVAGYRIHWGRHLVDAERHLSALNARNLLA